MAVTGAPPALSPQALTLRGLLPPCWNSYVHRCRSQPCSRGAVVVTLLLCTEDPEEGRKPFSLPQDLPSSRSHRLSMVLWTEISGS